MSKQQLIIGLAFTALSFGSAGVSVGQDQQAKSKTLGNAVESARVAQRRSTLPAGWFKQGGSGALTDTKVADVRRAAHFDTTGETNRASRALQSIQRVRDAEVYKGLKSAPPATNPPNTAGSSRRPRSVTANDPTSAAEKHRNPAAAERVARAKTASRETIPRAATTESSVSVTPDTQGDLPAKRQTAAAAVQTSRHGGDEDGVGVIVEELPSVMKTPKVRQQTPVQVEETRRMTLTAIEAEDISEVRSTEPLNATPVNSPERLPENQVDDELVLIKNESPVLSVVTRGPKTIVVGKAATYMIDLKNQSDVAAKDVIVRVTIPQWIEVMDQHPTRGSAHIQPDDSGQAVLSWQINQLPGRGQEKLTLELIPRGSRPVDLGVTWTFSPAKTITQIQVQEPKLQMSVVGPQDVQYGETKVYTVTVSNPGTGPADNVVLNLLPLVPGEKTAGVRNLGTIGAGERRTIEVELTTRQTGRLHVRAEALADGGLQARAQQEVLVRRATLEVVVDGPGTKYAGTRARYTLRIANSGDATASDVNVIATLPAGAKEVASNDGGSLDPNTGQVQWRLGILRPGATRVLELETTLTAAGDNRMDVRTVAAGDLSALGAAVTQVESLADLKLTVNDPPGAVAVGADVAYEVRIMNRGTKEAGNIQLYGYFSDGVEPVKVAGWRGQINEGEVVLQTIPRLGAGQEMVVRIIAQADRSGDHVFRAELECTEPQTKLAVEEWTRFYGEGPRSQRQARKPTGQQAPAKKLKLQRY